MMRVNMFGYPGVYDSGGYDYPNYGYYGFEPDYGMRYDVGQPFMGTSRNLRRQQGMPIEIPITHEGSSVSSTEHAAVKPKQPKIPEDVKPCHSPQPRKHTAPKHHSSVPYPTKQVPLTETASELDDENPFFSPRSFAEAYEDDFPFGSGFPFQKRLPRDESFANVPVQKSSPKRTADKAKPKTVHTPNNKTASKTNTPGTEPRDHGGQYSYKVRQVPIVREEPRENDHLAKASKPEPAKRQLTPIEQLTNIQKEMEAIASRVENFSGEKKDKEYIILDETLTSLLLKLDTIESNNVEEIRNTRRKLVRNVQEFVQKLESKVGIVGSEEGAIKSEVDIEQNGGELAESTEEGLGDVEMGLQQDNPEPCDEMIFMPATEATGNLGDQEKRPEAQISIDEKLNSSPQLMYADDINVSCDHRRTDKDSDEPQMTAEPHQMEADDMNRTPGYTELEQTSEIKE